MNFLNRAFIVKGMRYGAILLLSFLTFEISLRIFWKPYLDTRTESLVTHDPLYGWQKTPHAKAIHRNIKYTVIEAYNSKGLRGPEYFYEKPAEEYRVLVLGDSHAEGHSVKFNDLFSEVLKRNLNQSGAESYEVINAGTGGYSTDQELLFFKNEAKKYRSDLVILAFSLNNVWYNSLTMISSWHKPLFVFKDGVLQLTHVPVPKPAETSSYQIRKFFKNHCYSSQFFYEKIKDTPFYDLLSRWGLTPFPNQFRVWQKKETPQLKAAWELTEALIVKLRQEVESSGSDFMVLYVPVAASVYPEAWQEKQQKYGFSDTEWNPTQDSKRLEAICRKHGIDLLNPLEHFKEAARQPGGEKLYSFKDEHWIPDGHRMAGNILEDYVRKNYLETAEK